MNDPTPNPHRSFLGVLGELEDGRFVHEVTEALQQLIGDMENAAANPTSKVPGKMTITLNLMREEGYVEIRPVLAVVAPKPTRRKSVFFVTPENLLTRRDPRQVDMFIREVGEDSRPTRVVTTA